MNKLSCLFLIALFSLSCLSQKTRVNNHKSTNDATVVGGHKYPYTIKFKDNPLSLMNSAAAPNLTNNEGLMYCPCRTDKWNYSVNLKK